MDVKQAWKNFEKTGDITDYLEFCKQRKMEENSGGKEFKSEWDNNRGK